MSSVETSVCVINMRRLPSLLLNKAAGGSSYKFCKLQVFEIFISVKWIKTSVICSLIVGFPQQPIASCSFTLTHQMFRYSNVLALLNQSNAHPKVVRELLILSAFLSFLYISRLISLMFINGFKVHSVVRRYYSWSPYIERDMKACIRWRYF